MTFEDFYKELTSDERWFEQEEWRPIPGYDGQYIVSESGKVFRLPHIDPRKSRHKSGTKLNYRFTPLLMKPYITKRQGYYNIVLKGTKFPVHRLVAMAWHPNPENKPQVNHIDNVKSNNHYSNLEWVTAKENINHAAKLGLYDGKGAKLTGEQVSQIKATPLSVSSATLGVVFSISSSVIRHIRQGKTWKHI